MAIIKSREALKDYCLRRLGHPVIQINVDDAQIEDRIDDALQYFAEYHFDGSERVYLQKQVTDKDVERGYFDLSEPTEADEEKGIKAAPAIDSDSNKIVSIVRIFQLYDTLGGTGMFDARYQIALNDLYGLRTNTYSQSMITYDITRRHMGMLQDLLTPEKQLRFSRVTNKVMIDMDWKTQTTVGNYMLMEAYAVLDPEKYNEIYNDIVVKRYTTALIKEQWGMNLIKFKGIELPGGITIDGDSILAEALKEKERIEEEIQLKWELPPGFFIG